MKRILSLLLALSLLLSCIAVFSASAADTGIQWSFDKSTGTLTVSGSGDMPDYKDGTQPWADYMQKIKKAVIKKGVTSVGELAFFDARQLKTVSFPSGLKKIGSGAFAESPHITGVDLPSSLEEMGRNAFEETVCQRESGLTYLDHWVVGVYSSVTQNVKIRGGTVGIAEGALTPLYDTVSVYLPTSLRYIGTDAFAKLNDLEKITVSSKNKYFTSVKGFLCTKDDKELILIPPAAVGKTLVIPEGIRKIRADALGECRTVTTLSLPASLESFSAQNVKNCTQLKKYTVADGSKKFCAGSDGVLYSRCKTILYSYPPAKTGSSYTVNKKVTSVGTNAFYGAKKLGTVILPEGLKKVGSYAFKGCAALENAALPDTVTSLGKGAFSGCKALRLMALPTAITSVPAEAFAETGLASLLIPTGVTSIGEAAFEGCYSMTDAVLPDTVKKIGQKAFTGCHKLKNINLPEGLTEIGDKAFYVCIKLTSVKLPDSLTKLGKYAFADSGLTDIVLPPKIKTVREGTFYETDIRDIVFPYTVTTIEKDAVSLSYGCLQSVTVYNKKCKILLGRPERNVTFYGYKDSTVTGYLHTYVFEEHFIPLDGIHKTHKYVSDVTKATMKLDGEKVSVCSLCGKTKTAVIPAVKSVTLSKTSYTYNGKAKKPTVTVKDVQGKTLVKDTDYTVKYSNNTAAGKASAKITFKGLYSGTKTVYFTIR